MTLDELIKQAGSPTPEFLRELNKAVWEAQKNHHHGLRSGPSSSTFYCVYCGVNPIPDYAKPENFWPLFMELVGPIYRGIVVGTRDGERIQFTFPGFLKTGDLKGYDWEILGYPGIAVCLAYLKVKESEALINELDLPDAEDILKMRGKVKEQENNGKQNA